MAEASLTRKMFEIGAQLKAEYGEENVYDFSLGNPNVPPGDAFTSQLKSVVMDEIPNKHSYMPNAGYPFVREAVAGYVTEQQETPVSMNSIVMTCGAGGGMNAVLKTILNAGDRVLVSAPCFMEYKFYIENHGGQFELVSPRDDLSLDPEAFEAALDSDVAAVILCSPNNPSGVIYSEENLKELIEVLKSSAKKTGRPVYLLCDEPYRKVVFDGMEVPAVFPLYDNTIIVTSYSKDFSIPGERIGYAAVNPAADDYDNLMTGIILCNRIIGFVNAPALMQRVVAGLQGKSADVTEYERKRDILCEGLSEIGYEFFKPQGTFYLFPRAPGGDGTAFIEVLQKERVLAVPGKGFGMAEYFRIAFCVEDKVITRAMDGFKKAFERMM